MALRLPQQLRQLRHVRRDPSRLILAQQFGGRSAAGVFLVVNIRELLPATVLHGESGAGAGVLDSGHRERHPVTQTNKETLETSGLTRALGAP